MNTASHDLLSSQHAALMAEEILKLNLINWAGNSTYTFDKVVTESKTGNLKVIDTIPVLVQEKDNLLS